ncbi:MAG: hypothetical protein JWM95_2584 [Gemmatimonadetes bacterium]|nr:hypothetical protein [Gemmatimonadota bacterium]
MLRSTTLVVVAFATSANAHAPRDTVARLDSIAHEVARIGARHGEAIWPGFRPDTIPLSFVLPSHGDVLFGWRGTLPQGYVALDNGGAWRGQRALGAASTGTMLEGRRVAQVVVNGHDAAMLVATALHEAFHVFENASKKPAAKFGRGENSMLVSTYPVFDVDDEAAFALEGKILAAALTSSSKRTLARQFVAVRRARHRRLPGEFAEFDQLSELNEGLAEYVLVRGLRYVESEGPRGWRAVAASAIAARTVLLANLTGSENLSLRFRYYQTGPAQALLLDDLAGPTWKTRMLAENSTLQDMLAVASGVDSVAMLALRGAAAAFDTASLRARAESGIGRLRSARRAKADSLLSQPGVLLVLAADSLPGKDFNACGYDPQNLLQVTSSVNIQMRWWKPCAVGLTSAEFNVPSVHDEAAGTIRAVLSDVTLTSNGVVLDVRDGETMRNVRAFKLDSPRASVQAVRADISRSGATLSIWPKAP